MSTVVQIILTSLLGSAAGVICYLIGVYIGKKEGIEISKLDPMSIFETNYLNEGMKIFDNFLEIQFLKYVHNLLVGIANKSKYPIKAFLDSSLSEDDMNRKTVGFLTTVSLKMSQDLKKLFYRYYSKVDDNGAPLNTLEQYITEWFILRVRKINAEYMAMIGENVSDNNLIICNSQMFVSFEMELYEKMGLIKPPELNVTQKDAKKLLK